MRIRRPRTREVSKSMIAFTLALLGVLALAVQTWLPGLIGTDSGVHVTRPGLFTVSDAAAGIATLRGGASVVVYGSGIRVRDRDGVLLDTVPRGAPLSIVRGSVTGTGSRRIEHADSVVSNVRIDTLVTQQDRARMTGVVYDKEVSWPMTLDISIAEDRITLAAHVPGVDALVWHLATDFDIRGYAPTLPERNLKTRAWWLKTSVPGGDFTSARGADIRVRPADVLRALDIRETGRIDVHIWSAKGQLVISRRANPLPSPSTPTKES
ncbi:hypothetical protein [Nostocoides sp.]|uniref:hypothetical protein n=1 Tax=Nostocoides sp. TaxID=1917966 RepID=UPI002CB2E76A|nr:hypothetical protein [Tetrasphaera sp.]